jgi:hypothetical protein
LDYRIIVVLVIIGLIFFFFQKYMGRESAKRKMNKLNALLQSFGIDTQLADRNCAEEKIGSRGRSISGSLAWVSGGDSMGIIRITTGSISWLNVLEYQFDDSPTDYWYVYGIPDNRIHPRFPKIHLKSSRLKESWRGKIIGVKWQGHDDNIGIEKWLSQQTSLRDVFSDLYERGINADLEINSEPNHFCWTISTKIAPTFELWKCYQSIAIKLKTVNLSADVITS